MKISYSHASLIETCLLFLFGNCYILFIHPILMKIQIKKKKKVKRVMNKIPMSLFYNCEKDFYIFFEYKFLFFPRKYFNNYKF